MIKELNIKDLTLEEKVGQLLMFAFHGTEFNDQLLKEIIASSIVVIITKIKEDGYWDDTMYGNNIERGSVSEAINYFVNTLEWDVSDPENTSLSIRKFLEEGM